MLSASIVACSHDRADSLRNTLHALQALQASPVRAWEVIFVDTSEKDHTKAVADRVRGGLAAAWLLIGGHAGPYKVASYCTVRRHLRRWRFQTSRNIAQSRGTAGGRRLFNVPLCVYPQLLRAIGRMVWSRLTLPADEAFNREIVVVHFLGLMQGLYRSR